MSIPLPKKRLEFGWSDPKELFSEEAYEDNLPFMLDMTSSDKRAWQDLMQRATIVDPRHGRDSVIAAWKKQVLEYRRDPDEVAQHLQQQIMELEKGYQAQQIKVRQQEMEAKFKEAILKEEALSEIELEAINCTLDTTRDLLLAAGHGSKWFRIDKMDPIHQAMARRLRDNDMLESRKVYNEQAFAIFVVHRLKGT